MAETPGKPPPNRKRPIKPPLEKANVTAKKDRGVVTWDQETKARAVGMMIAGSPYTEVQKVTGVPFSTLQRWFAAIGPEVYAKAREGQKSLVDLIEEFARESLTTSIEQAKIARDPEWVKRQNAADLAVYNGVMIDKTVRVVQVLEAASQRRAALTGGES